MVFIQRGLQRFLAGDTLNSLDDGGWQHHMQGAVQAGDTRQENQGSRNQVDSAPALVTADWLHPCYLTPRHTVGSCSRSLR